MNFDSTADELHRQERARLADAVTPRPEQLRSMTAAALRVEIAGMWERLGNDVITNLAARIREFWQRSGFEIKLTLYPVAHGRQGSADRRSVMAIKSNLVAGLPPRQAE